MSNLGLDSESPQPPDASKPTIIGMRKNGIFHGIDFSANCLISSTGKSWHNLAPRRAFRPTSGQTSYSKRLALRQTTAATKAIEREMKEEKDAQRTRFIDGIREKRKRKEEKEQFEKMEAKMHRKRVERIKRREKRNKMLGK
ncbi:MAG: hypothetical protein Q9160_004500 [Pyrenula sp. 1 TL-2023]